MSRSVRLLKIYWFEIASIIVYATVVLISVVISTTTRIFNIQETLRPHSANVDIHFSRPVSRLTASVYSYPSIEFDITWHNSIFKNALYKDLYLQSGPPLLFDQDYTIMVKGLRTIDRTKTVPVVLSIRTPSGLNTPALENFSYYEEKDEIYIFMNDFSDFKIRAQIL